MDRVSCVDIDRRTLADSEYKVIIHARKSPSGVIEGEEGGPVSFPYAVAIKRQGKYPSLLRFVLENLYWFMVERDKSRTGLIVVEDEEGWFKQKEYGRLRKPMKPCYFGLEFDWEPVEIYNGAAPSIVKANATVVRDNPRDSQGVVRFKVKRVRGVSGCGSDCAPSVRIEKVWQFVDEQRVTTFCATRDPLRFREDESVVEIRGVHPEVDGYHVVEEVFLEGDQYECNCFCFNGCQLLGNMIDEDTYLLWDRGGAPPSDTWAAERCRVEREGLYHVRIMPPDDRYQAMNVSSPGTTWQDGSQFYRRYHEMQMRPWGDYGDSMAQSYADHDPSTYVEEVPTSMSHVDHSDTMARRNDGAVQSQQHGSYYGSHSDDRNLGGYPATRSTEPSPPPVRHPMARSGEGLTQQNGYSVAGSREPSQSPVRHPLAGSGEVPGVRHPMAGAGESTPPPAKQSIVGSREPSQSPVRHPLAGSGEVPGVRHPMAGAGESTPPPAKQSIAGSGQPSTSPNGHALEGPQKLAPPPSSRYPSAGNIEPPLPVTGPGETSVLPGKQPFPGSRVSPPIPSTSGVPFHHLSPPPSLPQSSTRHENQYYVSHPSPPPEARSPPPKARSPHGHVPAECFQEGGVPGDYSDPRPSYSPPPSSGRPTPSVASTHATGTSFGAAPGETSGAPAQREIGQHVTKAAPSPTPAAPPSYPHPVAFPPPALPRPVTQPSPSMPPGLLSSSKQDPKLVHPAPFERHDTGSSKQGYHVGNGAPARPIPSIAEKGVETASSRTVREEGYSGREMTRGEKRPASQGEKGHIELKDLQQDLAKCFPPSIWNKSKRSASGSVRCQSPAPSQHRVLTGNRDATKREQGSRQNSIATRSSGKLDDTRLPKSPRLYESSYQSQPNSPRCISPQPYSKPLPMSYSDRHHTSQSEGKPVEANGSSEIGQERDRRASPKSNHQRHGEIGTAKSDHRHMRPAVALVDDRDQWRRIRPEGKGGKEARHQEKGERLALCGPHPTSSNDGSGGRDQHSRTVPIPVPVTLPGAVPASKELEGKGGTHHYVPARGGTASHSRNHSLQSEKESSDKTLLALPVPVPYDGNGVLSRKRSASPNRSGAMTLEPSKLHPAERDTHHSEGHSHRSRSPSQKSDRRSKHGSPSPDMRFETLEIPAVPTDNPSLKRMSSQEPVSLPTPLPVPGIPQSSKPAVPTGARSSERPSTPLPWMEALAIVPIGRPVIPIPSLTPSMEPTLPEPIMPSAAAISRPSTPMPAPTQVPTPMPATRRPLSAGPSVPVPVPKPSVPIPSSRPPIPTPVVVQKQENVPLLPQPTIPITPSAPDSTKRRKEKLPEPVQSIPRCAETMDLPVPAMKSEPHMLGKGALLPIPSLSGVPSLHREPSEGSIEEMTQRALGTKDRNSNGAKTPPLPVMNARGTGSVIVTDRPKPSNADRSKMSIGSLELVKQSVNLETEVLKSEQWQTAVANLALKKPNTVPGSLQTLSPDNPELSGLAGPRCSMVQLENAAVKFRSVVSAKVRESLGGILCGTNRDAWVSTCGRLIEIIGERLPNAIMQRGDFLYVVPRKLTPIISEALHSLDIPPSSMGGVLLHLFGAVDSVYRDVRIRISNGQAEKTPDQIYQDLEMDAIQKMNQPNLAEPQFKSDETGKIQMKVFPGTCVLQHIPSAPLEDPKPKAAVPVPVPVPVPVIPSGLDVRSVLSDSDSCTSLSRSVSSSVILPRPSPPKILVPECALPISSEALKVEEKLSISAAQAPPIPIPVLPGGQRITTGGGGVSSIGSQMDVFEGFEIGSMQHMSNEDVVEVVMNRLARNRGLFMEFLEGWLEVSGKDVFLERFLRLKSSTRATVADPGANSALSLGGFQAEAPGIALGGLAPSPIMPVTQLAQEPLTIPTLLSDIKPIPGLLGENVVLPWTPVPVNPSPMGGLIQKLSTPGDISEENMAELLKLAGQMPKIVQTNLSQPKFMNKIKDYIQGERPSQPLRKYQECCVETADSGGNYIFVAPTGSGKTKIFVECTRRLLKRKPDAKIVVICPTVPLASQQAAVFVFEGFIDEGYQINAFSGENPLSPPMWPHVRTMYHVMVMTPQILLSILDDKQGGFHEIDLLVLDECHHCRGDHPYSKIMDHYRSGLIAGQKRAQVLGFTASPAKSSTLEQACAEMQQLLEKTNAECMVINEDNKEVQQHVPSAEEETLYIEPREEDQQFSMCMGKYLFNACAQVLLELIEENPCLQPITQQVMVDLNCGVHSPAFENWCKKSVELLVAFPTITDRRKQILRASIELLRACNITLDLVKEGGFEVALRTISKSIAQINLDVSQVEMPDETIYMRLCLGLYNIQPIRDVSMSARAFHMTDNAGDYRSFPRFVAIVRFLEQYKHQDSFHGIIFCRTRDAVYSLTDMLRQTPALYFVQAMPFIGHGRTTRRSSKGVKLDGNNAALAVRGMTGTQQRDVLSKFQSRGRHVLVSTRAAEEGINVTTCAFVVRYSVTETGIERIQSRGRTRVHGGKFVNIVEKESKEGKMFLKSVKEEATMNQVLKLFANAHHVV